MEQGIEYRNVKYNKSALYYTGRFIRYSGITNIYYRKTIGHAFTKTVQIEETTRYVFPQ